jgi:RNA-splicing ligase RtcB
MAEPLKQFLGKEAVPIFGWTQGVTVEEQAMQQLKNIASLPFIHKHVAVMPDVHLDACLNTVRACAPEG